MGPVLLAIVWLFLGYCFTYWFVNYFLDNRRWDDTGNEVGPFGLLMLTLAGPVMAVVMLVFAGVDYITANFGEGIKRFYGMRD